MNLALVLLTSTVDNALDRNSYILGEMSSHPLAAVNIPLLDDQQEQ